MELKRDRWFVRWFHYSSLICDEFFHEGRGSRHRIKDGISLCIFTSTIFLGTVIAFLHAVLYLTTIAVLTAFPIYLFGATHYLIAVAILAIVCFLGAKIILHLEKKKKLAAKAKEIVVVKQKRESGFVDLLWQYAKATKEKVCPIIYFD
ncbi:MAG TPA: hypothetical protein VFM02_02785 [Candidatus Paceibacterota bacterium]|nr:hypothetical protein [Candidatus Paceibacterota bacterium]